MIACVVVKDCRDIRQLKASHYVLNASRSNDVYLRSQYVQLLLILSLLQTKLALSKNAAVDFTEQRMTVASMKIIIIKRMLCAK